MSEAGSLVVVGLGPGTAEWLTPAASDALARATDLVGYGPYLDRAPCACLINGGMLPTTGSRSSVPRWRSIWRRKEGTWRWYPAAIPAFLRWRRRSSRRSTAASCAGRPSRSRSSPASPRCSPQPRDSAAPLGGDFCAMSLSDNLKPWETIVQRLTAALNADFVISLYNPISSARPWQLGEALKLAGTIRSAEHAGDIRPRGRPAQ